MAEPVGRGALAVGVLLAGTAVRAAVSVPQLSVIDPPAYGFQIGDVVERQVQILLPPGARLDSRGLPTPTRQGGALELVGAEHHGADDAARQRLHLRYQVLRSPEQPAVFELPALELRVSVPAGEGLREALLRLPTAPVMVGPIAPLQPPERAGLGALQPDLPPPVPAWAPIRQRAQAWAALALLALGWLLWRHALRPLWRQRQRPLARAWRDMRRLLARPGPAALEAAMRRLHAGLDEDAGRVLLASDLPAWLQARPQHQAQAEALLAFGHWSAQHFYGGRPAREAEVAGRASALRALARALAAAEARA